MSNLNFTFIYFFKFNKPYFDGNPLQFWRKNSIRHRWPSSSLVPSTFVAIHKSRNHPHCDGNSFRQNFCQNVHWRTLSPSKISITICIDRLPIHQIFCHYNFDRLSVPQNQSVSNSGGLVEKSISTSNFLTALNSIKISVTRVTFRQNQPKFSSKFHSFLVVFISIY